MTILPIGGTRVRVPSHFWLWAALGVLVLGFCLAWLLLPVSSWLAAVPDWIRGLGIVGTVIFGLLYVAAALTLAPDWPLSIGAGLVYGMWGVPLVLVAAVAAAGLAFLIARYLAREAVRHLIERRRHIKAVDRAVAEDGWKIVFLMRLSPLIPFNLQNYVLGLTAISFHHYLAATAGGILPGTLVYVYLGTLGASGNGIGGPLGWSILGVGVTATLALTIFVSHKVKAKLRVKEP